MTPRRTIAWAATATAALLVVGAITQLRPFWWDTHRAEHSVQVFEQHRALLMGGAWARILLLFPMTALGIALPRLLDGASLQARLGTALAVAGGALSAVSGVAAVAIGVTAEEFVPLDGSSRALAVLADSLYWMQDNLLTLSLIAFSAALAAFSSPLWRLGRLPAWARRAGQASVVSASAIPLSFYVEATDHGSWAYAVPAYGAETAILLWLVALIVWVGPERRPMPPAGSTP